MKTKPLITIFLIVFINSFGFGIILPFLPYIAQKFGANSLQIGIIVASFSLFQFLSTPILGDLSDNFGRKKLLIFSQLGSVIGFIILGLANSFWLLVLARVIDGITGGNISIAQAYMADVTSQKERAKGMGLIGAANGLGFIFGPAVGGLLSIYGYTLPSYLAAFFSLLTVLATWQFLEETVVITQKNKPFRAKRFFNIQKTKQMLLSSKEGVYLLIFFLFHFSSTIFETTFVLWTKQTFNYGPFQNGLLITYFALLIAVLQLKVLGILVKKLGEKRLLRLSLMAFSLGVFILTFRSLLGILLSAVLLTFGIAMISPSILSLASKNAPEGEQGEVMGILSSLGSLGRVFGPVVGGEIFLFGKETPFLLSSLVLLGSYFFLRIKKA